MNLLLKFEVLNRIVKLCAEKDIASKTYLDGNKGIRFVNTVTSICENADKSALDNKIKTCLELVDDIGMDRFLKENPIERED